MRSELARFVRGFGYAAKGIALAIGQERNFRFHLCAAGYVAYFAARFYTLSRAEWAVLILCLAGVPALELVNSAVERAVESPDAAHWGSAGAAKDLAAGAVLAGALGSVAVGVCLFWRPAVILEILRHFTAAGSALLLAVSLCAAFFFVFGFGKKKPRARRTE